MMRRAWLSAAAGVLAGGWAIWRAFRTEPARLTVSEHRLSFPPESGVPPQVRIAHLTDLHLRGWGPAEQAAARAISRADPDLVVFTGDYIEHLSALPLLTPVLKQLCRGRPAYAVLGDNDDAGWLKASELVHRLSAADVEVLRNEARLVRTAGGSIWLVGVDDPHSGRARLDLALRGVPQRREGRPPVVLLAHSPEIVADPRATEADLILVGHTHGGQICLPGWGPIVTNSRLGRRYARGRRMLGQSLVYTNRGLGMARIPARFACPPELALFSIGAKPPGVSP
ncbi:MAG TPA: metallophosphoesterase [Limnochordia bacterium]